jgi:hypothetical protein
MEAEEAEGRDPTCSNGVEPESTSTVGELRFKRQRTPCETEKVT